MCEKTLRPACGPTPNEILEIEILNDPLLAKYWPSERRAILAHRFFLSLDLKREATLQETLRSWEAGACVPWRRDKMRRDGQQQIREIERHKYLVSQKLGYDVGAETAATDWIEHHAAAWREWWEMQPESGA